MELLTHSRLRAYRKCARYEALRYREGWRPARDSEALVFGTLWHLGTEAWSRATGDARLTDALAAVAGKAVDPYVQAKLNVLLEGYHTRWADAAVEFVGVEEPFDAPLINPDTMQPSRTFRLAGKSDARVILRDGSVYDGQQFVFERKTSAEDITPGADYWIKLAMDFQLTIYLVGAESCGHEIAGAIYDVVSKPMLRPLKATPEASRKYTKDGKLHAAQRTDDETPTEYEARLRAAVVADLDGTFARRIIPRTESQIRDCLADLWASSRVMHEAALAGRAPRNPEACHLYNQRCEFWSVCAEGLQPAERPDLFRKADDIHPELTAEVSNAA